MTIVNSGSQPVGRIGSMLASIGLFLVLGFSSIAAADNEAEVAKVRAELGKMVPAADDAEIVASPVPGVFRIQIQGNYAYAYVDGDFILLGDLYNTKDKVNLGDQASNAKIAERMKDVSTDQMIVFGPKDPKRYITVFTDIDCGYCRKLHREVPELTAAGIQVRYLAFPRAGVGSESHKKYVSVWCNDNQQQALTTAKSGGSIASATCSNPISATYKLGQEVGVRGTPTIIYDDGTVTPGYIPSARMISQLGLDQG